MTAPKSVSSNRTGLAIAEEESLMTLPTTPVWFTLEPNSYSDFGPKLSSVARSPINALRQRFKGTTTDMDVKAGWNSDLTQNNLTRLLQGFAFMDALEKACTNPINGDAGVAFTDCDTDSYNAASGLNTLGFVAGMLILAKGWGVSGNNGLKKLSTVAAGALTISTALVAEVSAPAGASVEAVGFEFPSGDLALTIVGNTVVLTSAAKDPTTFGLHVGEWLFVGGDAAGNAFALNLNGFYGRIKTITATTIVLELTSVTPVADAGAGKSIRIFFGKSIRNATQVADIKRRTYQCEREMGDDGDGTQAEYAIGAVPNELTFNINQTDKVTVDVSFVALGYETVDGATGPKSGTRVAALGESAINTSMDLVMFRLAVIDGTLNPTALYEFASEGKITIKNGITPNKALAVIGGFEASEGDFEVDGTVTAYFQTLAAIEAIKNNDDAGLSAIFARANSGIVLDIPLCGLGDGSSKVEKDKPITVAVTQAAAMNAAGYTMLMTFFTYLPTVAV
jgi:hypothetical protein